MKHGDKAEDHDGPAGHIWHHNRWVLARVFHELNPDFGEKAPRPAAKKPAGRAKAQKKGVEDAKGKVEKKPVRKIGQAQVSGRPKAKTPADGETRKNAAGDTIRYNAKLGRWEKVE